MADSTDIDPRDVEPDEPTDDEIAQIVSSSPEERAAAQSLVLRGCSERWQKVAKVIADLLDEFERNYPHLSIAFLQATMEKLEEIGKVEITGDVWTMRQSEIRLAKPKSVSG